MIVFAILSTIAALAWTVVVYWANAQKTASAPPDGIDTIMFGWAISALFWVAWYFT